AQGHFGECQSALMFVQQSNHDGVPEDEQPGSSQRPVTATKAKTMTTRLRHEGERVVKQSLPARYHYTRARIGRSRKAGRCE
ncbi:hypothetical protein QU38_01715, partial [Staphylococcus aureus]